MQFLNASFLRDAAIFAGAYVAIQGLSAMQQPRSFTEFESYEYIHRGFVPIMHPLIELLEKDDFHSIASSLNAFLELCSKGSMRKNGFRVNELGMMCVQKLKFALRKVKMATDDQLAMRALSYETDELPIFDAIVTDTLRNFLLDAHA